MAVAAVTEYPEQSAHDAYLEHVRDCLSCDPGASWLCRRGLILHARWRAAEAAQDPSTDVTGGR